jgi:hypothetical protein
MKHILNNISSEEKNSILEQHIGGKTIDTSKFKKLLESQLGDVKPLISEQTATNTTQPAAGGGGQSKTVTLNGKQVPSTDPKTNQPINYLTQLATAYKDQPVPGGGTFQYKGENPEVSETLQFYAVGKPQNDTDKFVIQNLGLGGMLYNVYCKDIDKRDKLFSDSFKHFKKGENVATSITPIKMDQATKLMMQRYCMAKYPDSEFAYYQTTPKY